MSAMLYIVELVKDIVFQPPGMFLVTQKEGAIINTLRAEGWISVYPAFNDSDEEPTVFWVFHPAGDASRAIEMNIYFPEYFNVRIFDAQRPTTPQLGMIWPEGEDHLTMTLGYISDRIAYQYFEEVIGIEEWPNILN